MQVRSHPLGEFARLMLHLPIRTYAAAFGGRSLRCTPAINLRREFSSQCSFVTMNFCRDAVSNPIGDEVCESPQSA
ncbi:hypothetical protein RRSWK_01405 [Rhodopirellula sp. SWK7]|nr:hypothetical protein RRSWK_01405 [Rhodopirellula sp. SWK7]